MNLNLLSYENFAQPPVTYSVLLLDSPYNYISGSGEWIDWDFVEEHSVLKIDHLIFEEIFDSKLNTFDHFDNYGITDFYKEQAIVLADLLKKENKRIHHLTDDQFRDYYEFIFDAIEDNEDFIKEYEKKFKIEFVREDVYMIMESLINCLDLAIKENKAVTIVGI